MKAEIKDGKLIVEIELTEYDTEKTHMVASSRGNQPTTATYKGKPVIIGLNAYIKK